MPGDPTKARRGADAANQYAARLLQHLVVPTFVIDADRRVVVWNRACERLTGVSAIEVLGTRNHWQAFYEENRYCLVDLVALNRQDLIGDLYSEFIATKDDSLGSSAENWCMMPRLGNHLYLAIDAGPIHDDDGNLIAVVETLRDMTEHKRAEMALRTLAAKDALTGLANRRSFDQAIEIEWARAERSGRPLALLFADVDHFKLFNDNHGHQRGDECLRDIAGVIGKTVRLGGIVDRTPHPAAAGMPLSGGPQMVEVSRDGRRVYFTNSLYGAWDDQFYPDGVGAWMAKLDADPDGGLSIDERFFPHGDEFRGLRVHQIRLQGGDASSDSYCYS